MFTLRVSNTLAPKFNPPALAKTWEPYCRDVLNLFCPPDRRLLCGFDSKGELSFEHLGYGNARTFHTPTNGFNSWPAFLDNARCDDEGLKTWIARLKSDSRLLVSAALRAQKAADFIQGTAAAHQEDVAQAA